MPGFTHLQTAQPITFGHHMMAWFEMLNATTTRMAGLRHPRLNVMPLGAAALAGPAIRSTVTTPPACWGSTARPNSLDAVSDRDFRNQVRRRRQHPDDAPVAYERS